MLKIKSIATSLSLFFLLSGCNFADQQKETTDSEDSKKIEVLSPDEFQNKMNSTEQYTLLDVRTNMEVQDGHLKGMTHIDWFEDNFDKRVQKNIPKDQPVFVYCAIGGRSVEATEKLAEMGYEKVYDLDGGYNRWFEQQKPIEKPAEQ